LNISYIQHDDIDRQKWDRCIENAPNGLIYAHSWYLDAMSRQWDALVNNDYETVMPLTWNKKWGISYLRQPAFTQQLGIFGKGYSDKSIIESFINTALAHFPFAEINLNYANEYPKASAIKTNLILELNRPFIEIEKNFRSDFVKKVQKSNLIYQTSDETEKAIALFKTNYSERIDTSEKNYDNFLQLCTFLKLKEKMFIRKVVSQDGELLAMAIFLKDNRRIYYILSTTLSAGRALDANYFLLYHVIKEFSNQTLIFDFEGSEIPSIKTFFKKFGATEQPYPFVRVNHLPFLKRIMKKANDFYKRR
jgi:hypothetical protein